MVHTRGPKKCTLPLVVGVTLVGLFAAVSHSLAAADTTPPTISAIATSQYEELKWSEIAPYDTTGVGVGVTWKTDEKSSGKVEYSTTSGNYTGTVDEQGTGLVSHRVAISGLLYDSMYFFRIAATDFAGNTRYSKEFAVKTMPKDIKVLQVKVLDTGSDAAGIQVTVNRSQAAAVVIRYGTSSGTYTSEAKDFLRESSSDSTRFVMLVRELKPQTTYYFVAQARVQYTGRAESIGVVNESPPSQEFSFTTSSSPVVTSIEPSKGPPGSIVTVRGENFGKDLEHNSQQLIVSVGCPLDRENWGTPCPSDIVSWTDSEIKFRIADQSKTGTVEIANVYGYTN